jgi:hypothetical protein
MTTKGNVTILSQYYYLDTVKDGGVEYHREFESVYHAVGLSEAARIIEREGLSFSATGSDWAADPDGSYAVNYATGEECETSAFLSGFSDRAISAIIRKVG